MFKKLLRILLISCASLVGLVIALYLAVVLVNLGDGDLDPEAARLAEFRKPALNPKDNAYYLMVAFSAPEGSDAQVAGEQYAAALIKVFEENPNGTAGIQVYEAKAPLPRPVEALPNALRCSPDKESCLEKYLKDKEAYRKAAADRAYLLKRYAEIRTRPGFAEVFIPDVNAPFPNFLPVRGAREIELALAAQSVVDGDAEGGMRRIADIAAHDRVIVKQSRTLVGRMVGVRMVFESAQLASELLQRLPALATTHGDDLRRIYAPLEPATFDMSAAFETEGSMLMRLYAGLNKNGMDAAPLWGGNRLAEKATVPLYRRHDTMNDYLAVVRAQLAIAKAGPRDIEAQIASVRASQQKIVDAVSPTNHSLIRNPVGKILLGVGMPDLGEYKLRLVDLDGYLRLFGLQLALASASVAPPERVAWIRQNAPEARSPYDGSPLQYDEAKKALRFTGKGRQNALPGDRKTLVIALGG